jgi:hypothetical protein
MSRTRTSTALLLLASMAVVAGCTRNDLTAPSELSAPSGQPPLAHDEHQGANN